MEVEITLPPNPDILTKVNVLVSHCDLRVYQSSGAGYLDIGRGSFGVIKHIETFRRTSSCIGTVGQFCNFAEGCHLHGGGEHQNDLPVNVMLYDTAVLSKLAEGIPELQAKPHIPFVLGNGVLVSAHAQVLSGVKIGDGAMIAAGAVVTRDVEPFAIVGGVPAKPIKRRPVDIEAIQAVHWWDFDTAYIAENLPNLQALAVDTKTAHIYRKAEPRFILKWDGATVSFLGYIEHGTTHRFDEAPQSVKDYLMQLKGPGPYKWRSDIWGNF